jgi:DNA uptake protein ComE-like DNA-binding protein
VVELEWVTLLEMLGTCTVGISFDDEAVAVITTTPVPPATMTADCVDINAASLKDLHRIVHIGEARASQIVTLRPFNSVQGLSRISGIGESRLKDILDQGLACVP